MLKYRRSAAVVAAVLCAVAAPAAVGRAAPAASAPAVASAAYSAAAIRHIVVIYEENHSFDNLLGGWPGVDGLARATAGHTLQVDRTGRRLDCLPQNDVNLASPPQPVTCAGLAGGQPTKSAFGNAPFAIDDYIPPAAKTCPPIGVYTPHGTLRDSPGARPGGCTADIIHRFYTEQWQINGGKMNRFTAGSDAVGLTQGYYRTTELPLYRYLHGAGAPRYAIADDFFHAAFGGSFLSHQWLIAARTPTFPHAVQDGGPDDLHSIVGADGNPANTPLHPVPAVRKDGMLTQAAHRDGTCVVPRGSHAPPAGTVCGNYAVNTIQPPYQPYDPKSTAATRLPAQTAPTIGDRLTAAGVSWDWFSGGWDNAAGIVGGPGWTNGNTPGTCTDPETLAGAVYPYCLNGFFQTHHQPFNYYANYAPGTPGRTHLRDETEFEAAARAGTLPAVAFVKPSGEEDEHPGYASTTSGAHHLVDLLRAVEDGPEAASTMVIVTYDENGGQWDHVSPPKVDRWGPGTRIPALVISPRLPAAFAVDHTEYDTTSILATIEHRYGLRPLARRDATAHDLWGMFD